MIAIIDCGIGNLRSVYNAFQAIGAAAFIAASPEQLDHAEALVLPGVGAFGNGMARLTDGGFAEAIRDQAGSAKKPLLGICLGLQLLAEWGAEDGNQAGLGLLAGTVERLKTPAGDGQFKLPHIGWNDVAIRGDSMLYRGLGDRETFYFANSYALEPADDAMVSGTCDHGAPFVASVEEGNLCAVQFHPEKSQKAGLRVLRNWCDMVAEC